MEEKRYLSFLEFRQRSRFVLSFLLKEGRERSLLDEVLQVVEASLDLVHHLQLERGTSTQWLASSGKVDAATLAAVVARTTEKERSLRAQVAALDRLRHGRRFLATLEAALQRLDQMSEPRLRVQTKQHTFDQTYGVYSEAIVAVIAILTRSGERCPLPVEGQQLLALNQFVVLKEKAGQERATGAALLGGPFDASLWSRVLALGTEQERAIDAFVRHVDQPTRELWASVSNQQDFAQMEQYRSLIRQAKPRQVWPIGDAAEWFRRASGRIDAMHRVEQTLLSTLRTTVDQARVAWEEAFRIEGEELRGLRRLWLRRTKRRLLREQADLREVVRVVGEGGSRSGDRASQLWNSATEAQGSLLSQRGWEQREADARSQALGEAMLSFSSSVHQALHGLDQTADESLDRAAALRALAEGNRQRAEEVVVVTRQSNASVRQVTQSVRALADTLSRVRGQAEACQKGAESSLAATGVFDVALGDLSRASLTIDEAVGSIVDLASRTNLLSLNAAIEAARAGSSGAGFAVVAREVKFLATQTNTATERIVDSLGAIQQAVAAASMNAQSIAEVLKEMRGVFSETSEALTREDQNVQAVAAHLHQVAAGTSQVEGSMVGWAHSGTLTEEAAQRMEQSAQESSQALGAIRGVVEQFLATVQGVKVVDS